MLSKNVNLEVNKVFIKKGEYMISKYINSWLDIIEKMNNDNTYKLAWGRALLECISFDKCYEENAEKVFIKFEDIAECMIKYYWNQMFFFNLKQSPLKVPVVCQETKKLIDEYKEKTGSNIPKWFDEGVRILNKDNYLKTIKKVAKTLHENVAWRFKNVNKKVLNIYEIDKENNLVIFDYSAAKELKEYSIILSKLLNYKWAQLLEKFNFAPKITLKVNGISQTKLRRESLSKYKNELLKEFNDGKIIDFYTGEELSINNISIDHVIPWSFIYSDDIWNLVVTSKSNNSRKSNSIPSEDVIEKLKERNQRLLNIVDEEYKEDIKLSLDANYLEKFYRDCRL